MYVAYEVGFLYNSENGGDFMELLIMIIIFLITVIIGVPIVVSLGLASVSYVLLTGEFSLMSNLPQRMFAGLNSSVLLAIPFYIFLGEIMNSSGITSRLIRFSQSILGHFKGGLAYVTIAASGFLAAIIGSSNAVAAITSRSIVPEMIKEGYDDEYAASVSTASSTVGPIIPPSLGFILFGSVTGVSVSALFLGGILPGIILLLSFFIVAYIGARVKQNPSKERAGAKIMLKSLLKALLPLMLPALILGGIFSGVFTATEAGAAACFIALIIGMYIYREIGWKHLPDIIFKAANLTSIILIIAATANYFSWLLSMQGIGELLTDTFLSISNNPIIILLMINVLLLIIGCFMDPLPSILIFGPLLLPVAVEIGLDPVHFGVLFCLNLAVGVITPPVGMTLFVVTAITKVPVNRLIKGILPYIAVMIAVVLLIAYFPTLTMLIPNLFSK